MASFDDLAAAIAENLRVRGVHARLLAALEAEIAAALLPAAPSFAARAGQPPPPDACVMEALVADYLESRGLASTLSVFCLETGARARAPAAPPCARLSAATMRAKNGCV